MKLIKLQSKTELNEMVIRYSKDYGTEMLQSFEWGDLLQKQGEKIFRLALEDEGTIKAVATIIEKRIFGFSYAYCPRGPLGKKEDIQELIKLIEEEFSYLIFLRIEPKDLKIGEKTINLQPQKTLVLDLDQSLDELLSSMHQKTRYNIRLAQKKDLTFREGKIEDFQEFWRLMNVTSQRDKFSIHNEQHYYNLLINSEGMIKLFFIAYQGKNIATGIFSFWGNKVTYLHGASDNEYRNKMAPHLLQWELIKLAKKQGYKYYDFYGIDENKWPGVTRFKLGFGGEVVEYAGTRDIVFKSSSYYLYKTLRKLRRLW